MEARIPIVVLTPVRNEAWILERFLRTASLYADLIIIADQNSSDGSREIYGRFPKVHVIANGSTAYDEKQRQHLLVDTARELVPGPKWLLAIDADEIPSANFLDEAVQSWMARATPGTGLLIYKVDLANQGTGFVSNYQPFQFGYLDDGAPLQTTSIHGTRVPQAAPERMLSPADLVVLHYALLQPEMQQAKLRMYTCVESLYHAGLWFKRRIEYTPDRDYFDGRKPEPVHGQWLSGWEKRGIEMKSVASPPWPFWQDIAVLELMKEQGCARFWNEGIWYYDWERCLAAAQTQGNPRLADLVLQRPSTLRLLALDLLAGVGKVLWKWKRRLSKRELGIWRIFNRASTPGK